MAGCRIKGKKKLDEKTSFEFNKRVNFSEATFDDVASFREATFDSIAPVPRRRVIAAIKQFLGKEFSKKRSDKVSKLCVFDLVG